MAAYALPLRTNAIVYALLPVLPHYTKSGASWIRGFSRATLALANASHAITSQDITRYAIRNTRYLLIARIERIAQAIAQEGERHCQQPHAQRRKKQIIRAGANIVVAGEQHR